MVIDEKDALQVFNGIESMPEEMRPRAASLLADYKAQQDSLNAPLWPTQEKIKKGRNKRVQEVFQNPLVLDTDNGAFVEANKVKPGLGDNLRAREANILWLTDRYNADEADVRKRYDFYKADASQKWGSGTLDDPTLFNKAKTEIDADVVRMDKRKQATLTGIESALSGASMASELGRFLQAYPNATDDERLTFANTLAQTTGVFAPHKKLIDSAAPAMRRIQKGEATDADLQTIEDLTWTLAQSKGSDREILMRSLLMGAKKVAEEGGRRNISGTFAGSAVNLIENMYGAGRRGENVARNIDPSQPLPIGEPITSVQDALKAMDIMARAEIASRVPYDPNAPELPPARVLSDEEKAFVMEAKDRVKSLFKTERELKKIALSTDPMDESTLGIMASGSASSLSLMLPLMMGPQGLLMAGGGYANMEREELLTEFPDMNSDDASKIAILSGAAQAAMDKATLFGLDKFAPNVRKMLINGATKELVKKAALQGTALFAFENTIEAAQDLSTATIQQLVSELSTSVPQVDWQKEKEEFLGTRLDVAIGMVPLMLIGAGVNTAANKQQINKMLSNNDLLMRVGIIQEDRVKILELSTAGKTAEAQTALEDAMDRRSPELAAEVADRYASKIDALRNIQEESASLQDATSPEYTAKVSRAPSGWQVTTGDGSVIQVSSAEAANQIYSKLRQVGSQEEADTLVGVIDSYYEKERKAETNLTGEKVMAEEIKAGEGRVFAERRDASGALISQREFGPKALETVREEAEVAGIKSNTRGVFAHINGSNEVFPMRVADGAKEIVRRMNLYKSQAEGQPQVITFLHENFESTWQLGMANGTFSEQETRTAMRALLPAFEGVTALNAEESQFIANLRTLASGKGNETMLRETVSEMVIRDVLGRDRQGRATGMKPGSISRAIEASVMGANTQEEAGALKSILAAIKAFTAYLKGVFGTVDAITKARDEGKIGEEYDTFINKVLGIDEVKQMESQAIDEGMAMLGIDEETQAVIDAGNMAFSTSRAQPADTSSITEMPDGAQLVGPTTFSIEAYHGTPYEVDRFRTSKIGTGEGAQAYGWGLYFAKARKVAEGYRRALSDQKVVNIDGLDVYKTGGDSWADTEIPRYAHMILDGDIDSTKDVLNMLKERINDEFNRFWEKPTASDDAEYVEAYNEAAQEAAKEIKELKTDKGYSLQDLKKAESAKVEERVGNLYTVELLPDEEDFLDWDKPIDGMLQFNLELAFDGKSVSDPSNFSKWDILASDVKNGVTGKDLYDLLVHSMGGQKSIEGMKAASELLASFGIPGIRYLDGSSRAAGEGTSNYVIFDENLVKILEKNGQKVETNPGPEVEQGAPAPAPDWDLFDPSKQDSDSQTIKWKETSFSISAYDPKALPPLTQKIYDEISQSTDSIYAVWIDRMKVGNYKGIPLQGGMHFPTIKKNLKKRVVWAYNAKQIASAEMNKAAKTGGYMKLILMQEGNIIGNKHFTLCWFNDLRENIEAKLLTEEKALQELNRVRKLYAEETKHSKEWETLEEAQDTIINMGQIDRGKTYFQKGKLKTKKSDPNSVERISYKSLLTQKMTAQGFPDAVAMVNELEESDFKGLPIGTMVAIIQIDPNQKPQTAQEAGVPAHLSYGFVLKGRPVARIVKYQSVKNIYPEVPDYPMNWSTRPLSIASGIGLTFSISPAQDAAFLAAAKAGDMETAQRMVDAVAKAAGYEPEVLYHNTDASLQDLEKGLDLPAFLTPDIELFSKKGKNKFRFYVNRGKEFRPSSRSEEVPPQLMAQGYRRQSEFDTVTNWAGKVVRIDGKPSQIKSADPITYDNAGNIIPLSQRFNEATPDIRFSISPVRNLNELSDQVEKQFAENPVGALEVKSRVIRQFAKLADKWSNERWTPQGNKIRPISEKRTVKSLDKEQAMRQAQREVELVNEGMDKLTPDTLMAYSEGVGTLQDDPLIARMLNDNGKLMSKATAEREGRGIKDQYDDAGWIPPQWYAKAGGIMPDVMANNLGFDYASEMWAALESSIKSHRTAKAGYAKAEDAVKAVEKEAFEQARKEAQAWRDETDAMQKKDWSPRESLVRDLITLEAIVAMFPVEIRGKIGGFVALARKASESARLKVLQKQLERGQVLLEKHLKDQYGEATEKLLKRFKSQKDASGRITGKIISTATEQVDYAAEFIKLSIEEQADRQAALEKKVEESEDANEVQDALTKLGIARLFDMYSDKDSAARESAFNWLNDTIEAGKLGKSIMDEARKEMLTEMRQSAQSSILQGDELNPDIADNITNLNKGVFKRALLNLRGMLSEALWTTIQRLELIFGEDSKILNHFAEKIINAANLSTDIKRLVEAQKKDALSIIFNSDSKFAHARGIAELQKVKQSGISTRRVKKEEVKLDIETLTKLNDGTMSAETAGLRQDEVDAALEEFAANARKSTVTIEKVVDAGTPVERMMSETQGIQWWLWSMQDASRKQMERDGWDADNFKQLEEFLSPEAKALGRWISGSYQDAAGMIDPIYRKLFNAPLPRTKNYSPIHRRNMNTGGDIMDIDGSDMNSGLAAGFTKARVNTTASLVEMDALAVFLAHWENVSHWVSHAELMRDMKAILLDKDTAVAIRQKKSEGYLQRLKEDIKTIEKNGTNSASELVNISRVWRWFMQYRSYKGLAFRLSPIIKQTPALLNPLIADVPAHNYMMGMARAFIEPQSFAKEVSAMWSSDIIRRRIEAGFSAESRVAMQGAGMTGSQAIVAMQAGMMPMSMVDGGWTALGAAISFDYYRRGYMRDNPQMTPEIADSKAIARVEKMIATSAQPSDVYARSLSERSGNPFMKSMSMFVSDQRKALAIELMAIRRLATGKSKNKTLDIQRAFVAHFVQAGVSQVMAVVIASLLGDDEDRDRELSREQWTLALALGPINGLFVFGRLADKIGRGLLGLRVFPADDLASKVANDLLKGGKNMDELFNPDDADDFMDALDSSSTALGAGMSAAIGPAGGAVDVGANVLREARKIQKRLSE